MRNKILFIDANIYLRFYDSANHKFTSLIKILVELKNNIFITKQIHDEVNRNKLVAAITSFDANEKSLGLIKTTLPEHLDFNDDKKLADWNAKRNKIIKAENVLKSEYSKIVSNTLGLIMGSTDVVSLELEKIFVLAKPPCIDDIEAARFRKEMGNPPGKAKDPLGDQVSWEQLLREYNGNEIWIITNDRDYLDQYNGKHFLNPYLYNELKVKGHNKPPKVFLFDSLSKGIESFVNNLEYTVSTMPSSDELELIMTEEAEIHIHPKMTKMLVESSNISSIGYDPISQMLEIEFRNGCVYNYLDVPKEVYDGFISSSSIGLFFSNHIKGKAFQFIKTK